MRSANRERRAAQSVTDKDTRSSAAEPPEEAGRSRPGVPERAEADRREVHCGEVRRHHGVKKRMQHESFRKVRALRPAEKRRELQEEDQQKMEHQQKHTSSPGMCGHGDPVSYFACVL